MISWLLIVLTAMSAVQCYVIDKRNVEEPLVTFYREKDGHRTIEVVEVNKNEKEREIVDCHEYGDKSIAERLLNSSPNILVKDVNRQQMGEVANNCRARQLSNLKNEVIHLFDSPSDTSRSDLRSMMIFPGTKWCGAGNVSENYDDLGTARETDKCCRAHDHCKDYIVAYGTKHGLVNTDFYTKSNCSCDWEFYSCLQNSTELTSDLVGYLYFNILQTQCFKKYYPEVKCLEKTGILFIMQSCQKYKFDYNAPEKYEFFDAKYYKTTSAPEEQIASYFKPF